MNQTNQMAIDAGFDRTIINERGDSVRYLAVELEAPGPVQSEETSRPPLNLALVIDASGSMAGDRIHAAREAAKGIASKLEEGDRLSIVSFDATPTVHRKQLRIGAAAMEEIRAVVDSLDSGSTTNLSGGWLDGAECVAEAGGESSEFVNRVLLLSDGHANRGITEPAQLQEIAANLRQRGVLTSTVGIGDDYSTTQLFALAEYGGGIMHDAARPEDIVEVVLGEFEGIVATYAEAVELRLTHPPAVGVDVLGALVHHRESGVFRCHLGPLRHNGSRVVILKLHTPAGNPDEKLAFGLELHLRGSDGERETVSHTPPPLEFGSGQACCEQPRDRRRSRLVAERWQEFAVGRALELNREEQYEEAREYVQRELHYFRAYCKGLDNVSHLVDELEQAAERLARPMGERRRKDIGQHLYQRGKGMPDLRSAPPASWKASLLGRDSAPSGGEYYRLIPGHEYPLADIDGLRVLIGVGDPMSIASAPTLRLGKHQHPMTENFMGLTIGDLTQHLDTRIDVLLGMDILAGYHFTLDLPGGAFILSEAPMDHEGQRLPLFFEAGVPMLSAKTNGKPVSLFINSSTKMSYLAPALLNGQSPGGEVKDFIPGIGWFTTPAYEIETSLAGFEYTFQYGILPPLFQASIETHGAHGILGSEFTRHSRLHFATPQKELWVTDGG
ncbi:MAG: VWA domain-containing protein [Candidatus Hydrogenedentota bacterium]